MPLFLAAAVTVSVRLAPLPPRTALLLGTSAVLLLFTRLRVRGARHAGVADHELDHAVGDAVAEAGCTVRGHGKWPAGC